MTRRAGITTDPEHRKKFWSIKYPEYYGWQILGTYATKSEAQAAANAYAEEYECSAITGEEGPENANWTVYKFQY